MGWTTPATWNPGQVVSATDLNTHLRDNLNYLLSGRARQVIKRDNNANYATTSTSFVDIDSTNLAITLNLSGTAVLLVFTAVGNTLAGGTPIIDFDIDSTRFASGGTEGLGIVPHRTVGTIVALVTGLSAGNHTFKVKWKTASNTAALYAGNGTAGDDFIPTFEAVEIG
jgi:hypothetical protein